MSQLGREQGKKQTYSGNIAGAIMILTLLPLVPLLPFYAGYKLALWFRSQRVRPEERIE